MELDSEYTHISQQFKFPNWIKEFAVTPTKSMMYHPFKLNLYSRP